MIYNASAYSAEKDPHIRVFLHFVCTNEPGKDDFSNRLSAIVEKLKDNDKFKGDYLAMNLHDRDLIRRTRKEAIEEGFSQGISQGISQGATQKAKEATENLLRLNVLSYEQISQAIGLPLDKVQELAGKVCVNT